MQTDYVAKNWALAIVLKALPLVHFWNVLLLKEQNLMMTSVRKTGWSDQRKTDEFLAKFALKITTKSAVFYRLLFGEICPENSREISRFFREFVPKNPAKFDFFFRDLSETLLRRQTPLHQRKGVQISVPLKMKMSPKILAKGKNCPPVIKS